jgi:hypothetical protein
MNFVTGLRVSLVFLNPALILEKKLRILPGSSLVSAFERASSACSRKVGALRTLGFLILDFRASAIFPPLNKKAYFKM